MNLGKVFKQKNRIHFVEVEDFEGAEFYNPETSHLLISEKDNLITLTPREVSGMRLYLGGTDEALGEVTGSTELSFLVDEFAKSLQCPLIQIGFKNRSL